VLKGFSHYVQAVLPGGIVIALAVYWIFDLAVVILLFAIIFKFLPDAKIQWGDVWIGAAMTAIFFAIGKWALGVYLESGSAASAYGAASSLITLLLWVYYWSQILLFGAEFYPGICLPGWAGRCAGRTCDADLSPRRMGVPLWEKFDGPVFAIFRELDSSTPVQQVVPILGAALAR
jgi:hypothetical protein